MREAEYGIDSVSYFSCFELNIFEAWVVACFHKTDMGRQPFALISVLYFGFPVHSIWKFLPFLVVGSWLIALAVE